MRELKKNEPLFLFDLYYRFHWINPIHLTPDKIPSNISYNNFFSVPSYKNLKMYNCICQESSH